MAFKQINILSPRFKYFIYILFSLMLGYSISFFSYIYFYVTPVTNANAYFYSDRVIANYIRLTPTNKTLLLVAQPRYLYSAITLTNSTVDKEDIESFNQSYSPSDADEYRTSNLTVAKSCKDIYDDDYDTVIVSKNLLIDIGACPALNMLYQLDNKLPTASFVSPQDSGEEYRIFGDRLCNNTELSTYVHPTSLQDFKLEQMSATEFCTKWVVKQ